MLHRHLFSSFEGFGLKWQTVELVDIALSTYLDLIVSRMHIYFQQNLVAWVHWKRIKLQWRKVGMLWKPPSWMRYTQRRSNRVKGSLIGAGEADTGFGEYS